MTPKNIWHFDPITGEFLSQSDAEPDPMEEGRFLLPAYATFKSPPEVAAGQVAVMSDTGWTVKSDLRGAQYWLTDGSRHTIGKIGEDKPADALDAAPVLPPTDADINAEIVRRIALAWQADDQIDSFAKQINAQAKLDDLSDKAFTAAQKAKRNALRAQRRKTQHIRKKGAALKALGAAKRTGLNIADDKHWGAETTSTNGR